MAPYITERVLRFLAEQTERPLLKESAALEELGLDSLELLELQLACENKFGKKPTIADYNSMETVGDLARAFS